MQAVVWMSVAAFAGICAALQSAIAGGVTKKLSIAATLTLNTVVFTLICLVWMVFDVQKNGWQISQWKTLTFPEMLGGVFGFLLVLSLTLAFPRIGALYSVVLMILGQCLMALLIDQFGMFNMPAQPITMYRVVAIVLILGGVFLFNK